MNEQNGLKKIHSIAVIISAAIIASLFLLIIAVEVIKMKYKPFYGVAELEGSGLIRYVFYGLSIIQVVIIRFLRGAMLKKVPSDDRETSGKRLLRVSVVTSALCEIPAFLGLALFILGGFYLDFYILSFVSLFLLFMFFPRYGNWEDFLAGRV